MLDLEDSRENLTINNLKAWLNCYFEPKYNGPTKRTRCYSNRARKYHRKALSNISKNPNKMLNYIFLHIKYSNQANEKPKFWLNNYENITNGENVKADMTITYDT